ncbi:MAG: hypothetical protein QY309_03015 [Cyclobacteriaceae bacterium]|nr:MAG: hypothetical protein QY309_03015 [Cyclobacteriaceae bacterium]
MTADELIEEYKTLPRSCYNVDYSDKKALKKNNYSVTRMYQIVEIIKNKFGAEGIGKLKPLLDITDFQTNLWIATHLLEKVPLDNETEKKALSIIEKVASGDDVLALGYQFWMKEWKLKQSK